MARILGSIPAPVQPLSGIFEKAVTVPPSRLDTDMK
jgi:hypothetical protein